MTSHGNRANDGKVRLSIFLHQRFWFYCVPVHVSRHFSLSVHFSCFKFALYSNLNFPVNHILQVSCDWILCCEWYALHGAGRQVAISQTLSLPRCGIGSGHTRLLQLMENGLDVSLVFFYLQKAFNSVPHLPLLQKLKDIGLNSIFHNGLLHT